MLFSRHQPEWLYNAMPAIYFGAGIATLALVHDPIAMASGGLLIMAAATIVVMRVRYRRRLRQDDLARHAAPPSGPSRLASTTEYVRAMEAPKLGHADLDRQHRSLASKSASLRVAFQHNDALADLEYLAQDILDSLVQHLVAEAEALQRFGIQRDAALADADHANLERAAEALDRHRLGLATFDEVVELVAGGAAAAHLTSAHPALPSMEEALRQLREAQP